MVQRAENCDTWDTCLLNVSTELQTATLRVAGSTSARKNIYMTRRYLVVQGLAVGMCTIQE